MANEENLKKGKKTQFKSGENAARNGRKGGIASGVSKRRKKNLKNRIQEALGCSVQLGEVKDLIRSMGMDSDDATNYDALVARLLVLAIGKGDTQAIKMILDYGGETPGEKRAEKEEKRRAKEFDVKMKAIENLDKDNDAVLQFVNGMKHNGPSETE